jgi:hypothetical protein
LIIWGNQQWRIGVGNELDEIASGRGPTPNHPKKKRINNTPIEAVEIVAMNAGYIARWCIVQ